jgi:hypothetical protein
MLLKRTHEAGKCTGVIIKHTGLSPEQNFSRRLVQAALAEGWLTIEGDKLRIRGAQETLVYEIKRQPGYFCRTTGERIPISAHAWEQALIERVATLAPKEARTWLEAKGLPPTGYEVTHAYECVLDESQHEKYRAVVDPVSSNVVAAAALEG